MKTDCPSVVLRPAIMDDSEAIRKWRSDQRNFRYSRSAAPVDLPEHQRWMREVLQDPQRTLLVAENDGMTVGTIRFDRHHDDPSVAEISISVNPEQHGSGLGTSILRCALTYWQHAGGTQLLATIRTDNTPSMTLFTRAGFVTCGSTHGEWNLLMSTMS